MTDKVSSFLHDLKISGRSLRRAKLFTTISIATIALAVAIAGIVFSVVDTLVVRSLPYPDADRLVMFRTQLQDRDDFPTSTAEFLDYRNDSEATDAAGAWATDTTTFRIGSGETQVIQIAAITPGLQPMLGLETPLGRSFREQEGEEGAEDVAILSHSFWLSRFGGDPSVLDRDDVSIGDGQYRVIGVAAPDFSLPGTSPSIFLPLQFPESSAGIEDRSGHYLNVIARLADGVSFDQAVDESQRLMAAWEKVYAGEHVLSRPDHPAKLVRLGEWALGDVWDSIQMLIWGAALIVVLACANLSGLMIARGETRKIELGVRTALGAGLGRLIRLVMTEVTVLSVAGGLLGLVLSTILLDWVGAQAVGEMQVGSQTLSAASIDLRLTFFALLVAGACGIAFGVLPSLAAKNIDLSRILSSGGGRSRSGSRNLRRGFNILVFVQLALAAVLLNGTMMLIDRFVAATELSSGFEADNRFAFSVRMTEAEYPDESVLTFYDRAREEIASIPGVERVAAARALPMRRPLGTEAFINEGNALGREAVAQQVDFQTVSAEYYETMAIPLLAGRSFDERDRAGAPKVAMINRAAAVSYFGGTGEAIGKRIIPLFMGGPGGDPFTIVGVSENVRHLGPIGEIRPELTLPMNQAEGWVFNLLRRGELVIEIEPGAEDAVIPELRRTMAALAPGVPIDEPGWMTEAVRNSVAFERFLASLTTGFGFLALVIAAVGVLGVVWFSVNTRWREFGIRMALGETPSSIMALVLKQGLLLGAAGAATGLLATVAVERVVASVMPLEGSSSLLMIAAASAVLLATVIVACLIPAVRAGRLDPASVLGAD